MPTIAAIGNAFRIQLCWTAVNPRLGRYPKMSGNQAPQMKNSSTIIRISLNRTVLFIRYVRMVAGWCGRRAEADSALQPVSSRLGQLESFPIVAAQELIRIDGLVANLHHVGDAALRPVVVDLAAGAQRHHAEEHDLDQTRGVLERRRGLRLALDRFHPVHLMFLLGD